MDKALICKINDFDLLQSYYLIDEEKVSDNFLDQATIEELPDYIAQDCKGLKIQLVYLIGTNKALLEDIKEQILQKITVEVVIE